ncbi:MAG: hypothetical protein QM758_05495 [Armatimonas sp.]
MPSPGLATVAMTQEQNEQWQQAINPLDYLDFHALSTEGLSASYARLTSLPVPAWGCELRTLLIGLDWSDKKKEARVPEFALRSEVALVGLAVGNPSPAEAEAVYHRLLVRFVWETLHPFVEYAQQADRYRKDGYKPLVKLHQLCECFDKEGGAMRWPRHLEPFSKRVLNPFLERISGTFDKTGEQEIHSARDLSYKLHGTLTSILRSKVSIQGELPYPWGVTGLVGNLVGQHDQIQCNDPNYGETSADTYTYLIASAYLAALEAQCPPPDWLPTLCP